jgi:hypothetical protein
MSTLFNGNSAASALPRLREHGIVAAEALHDIETRSFHAPAWLAVVQGIAAWVAACMIVVSFFELFQKFDALSFGFCGGILIGVAVFLFYSKENVFFTQLALAFSLAGQFLVMFAFVEGLYTNQVYYLIGAVVAAALTLPRSPMLHRSLCTLLALVCLSLWIYLPSDSYMLEQARLFPGMRRLEILALLFAAMSVVLWLKREKWASHAQAVRFKALAHAGMLMNFGVMGFFCIMLSSSYYVRVLFGHASDLPIYSWGVVVLFLSVSFYLSRKLPSAQRAVLLIAALVFACAAHSAPWLLVCASLTLTAFHACHRAWFVLSLVGAVLLLGQFYYSLELSLLAKSGVLALSGAILLVLRLILQRWQKETA